MKSKTSFFNKTVFWKDVTRFAPVWVLYTVFLLIYVVNTESMEEPYATYYYSGFWTVECTGAIFYSLICGCVLFGDLFKTRLCNGLHAMPLRRECWFVTHFLAGMFFAAVPVTVKALAQMLMMGQLTILPLLTAFVSMIVFLFYFSLAALCAQLTGKMLAMVLVHYLLCILPELLTGIIKGVYMTQLFGVVYKPDWITLVMPLALLPELAYTNVEKLDQYGNINVPSPAEIGLYWETWLYLGLMVLVGVLLAAAAMRLYRRRNLERAGDFIVIKPCEKVFLFLYTMGAEALVYDMGFGTPLIGFVIGFFTGMMLLRRTVRIFNKRTFAVFGAAAVLYIASITVTVWDPAGITLWTPEPEEVKSISIQYRDTKITDPEAINLAVELHEASCEYIKEGIKEGAFDVGDMFQLTYELKNGRTVSRNIFVVNDEQKYSLLMKNPLVLTGYESWESFAEAVYSGRILDQNGNYRALDSEEIYAFFQALKEDNAAGNPAQLLWSMVSDIVLPYTYQVDIQMKDMENYTFFVRDDNIYTKAWIQENVYN